MAERVAAADGVVAHKLSPVTGSLLVEYDAHRIELPALIHAILDAGGFDGVEVDANVELPALPQGVRVRGAFDHVRKSLQGMTRGAVDMRTATPGTLAGLGVATLLFGSRRWPEWYDWMFWSFVTFVNLNPPGPPQPEVPRSDVPTP